MSTYYDEFPFSSNSIKPVTTDCSSLTQRGGPCIPPYTLNINNICSAFYINTFILFYLSLFLDKSKYNHLNIIVYIRAMQYSLSQVCTCKHHHTLSKKIIFDFCFNERFFFCKYIGQKKPFEMLQYLRTELFLHKFFKGLWIDVEFINVGILFVESAIRVFW